jgi:hypothetical protein
MLDSYFDDLGDGFPLILDDIFLTRDEKLTYGCKRELTSEFKMKDLDLMGLEVWHRLDDIFLRQGKYNVDIL